MAKYIIKTHYEPTEKNTNRAGDIHDWYSGKGGAQIGGINKIPSEWEVNNYGYSTFAAAKSALKAAQGLALWEESRGWWKVTVELLAF